jgi:protein with PEP-CTERM/exosortase system signal
MTKLLLVVAVAAFSLAQPVRADQTAPAKRAYFDWPYHQDSRQPSQPGGIVSVPDVGSTLPLLGCAVLGLAALRRKLRR